MKLLIRSLPELRAVVHVGDIEYATLKPSLRSAQEFLSRYVGTALLESLRPDVLTNGEQELLTPEQEELLSYVLVPIGNLAMLKYANVSNVRITDLGVMRTKDANSNDAFEWQLERAVATLRQEAFDGIEALLRYLETNLDTFPEYRDSDAYQVDKDRLIRSAEVFNRYYEIGSSRLVFQTMQAALRTCEVRQIRPILGSSLPALLAANPSDLQTAQLDAARRALVYGTVARALRERLVSITDTGVHVTGISSFGSLRYQQQPTDKQFNQTLAHFDDEAALALKELMALLQPPTPEPAPSTGGRVSGTRIVSF